jgi:hypothetical protein
MLAAGCLALAILGIAPAVTGCAAGVGRSARGWPDSVQASPSLAKDAARKVRARITPPILLWCSRTNGQACERVAGALGAAPVVAAQIPAQLLHGFRDAPNDCEDPTIRRIIERIEPALDLRPGSWADQVGTNLPVDLVGQRYEGGGCISTADTARPTVKIHTQPGAEPQLTLVRVWETDDR